MFRYVLVARMGARRIFSKGEQISKLGVWDENPSVRSRDGAPVGVWERSLQKTTTGCENNAEIIRLLSVLM